MHISTRKQNAGIDRMFVLFLWCIKECLIFFNVNPLLSEKESAACRDWQINASNEQVRVICYMLSGTDAWQDIDAVCLVKIYISVPLFIPCPKFTLKKICTDFLQNFRLISYRTTVMDSVLYVTFDEVEITLLKF